MSYPRLIVPDMNDFGRFDIIVTIEREGGILSDPARFVMAARARIEWSGRWRPDVRMDG